MPWLRTAFLAAAVVLLTILPVSQSSVLLALFVAVDLAAAALFIGQLPARTPRTVIAIYDDANLALMRRTVPQLRGHRPAAIIDAQVSWRQAAEFRRRRQELTQHLNI